MSPRRWFHYRKHSRFPLINEPHEVCIWESFVRINLDATHIWTHINACNTYVHAYKFTQILAHTLTFLYTYTQKYNTYADTSVLIQRMKGRKTLAGCDSEAPKSWQPRSPLQFCGWRCNYVLAQETGRRPMFSPTYMSWYKFYIPVSDERDERQYQTESLVVTTIFGAIQNGTSRNDNGTTVITTSKLLSR